MAQCPSIAPLASQSWEVRLDQPWVAQKSLATATQRGSNCGTRSHSRAT